MLSLNNLSIEFGSTEDPVKAVRDISFQLDSGSSLGLVGESGSGKSVTALSIIGLLPPQARITSGSILFDEVDILSLSGKQINNYRGSRISMIFQEPMTSLNPVMRCGKQVAEAIYAHQGIPRNEARSRVMHLFDKVQLPDPQRIFKAYPHELSGGQKQRVMIAMAMVNNPKLLIADEPTTALDVTVQKGIIRLLNELRQEFRMSLLFISHDLGIVNEVADRIAVMHSGRIVESGKTADVLNRPAQPYTKGLLASRPPLDTRLKKLPTVDDFINGTRQFSAEENIVSEKERKATLKAIYENQPLLNVDKLTKIYPGKKTITGKSKSLIRAVNDISFRVFPGETLGLVGESGCGKTTLGRAIIRLIEPDSGKIYFDNRNLLELDWQALKKERQQLGIVFQDPYSSLNPRMTIGRAIQEPMLVHHLYKSKRKRKQKTLELMEKVGLEKAHYYRYPHEFSGGQRQRIVIARALALHPRFIICDEAVSALDVSVQAKVLNLLNELKGEFGFTYIFISHDLSVVRFMSDRIMVMKNGKIIETGDADEIYFNPKQEYTRKLIASVPKGA